MILALDATPADIQFLWLIGTISVVLLALVVLGKLGDAYETYRQRKADRAFQRSREDAYVRARLNLASQIGVVPFQRRGPQ